MSTTEFGVRRLTIAWCAGLAVLGYAPAALRAQGPATYFACYVPLTGTVYRIKEGNLKTACTTGHVEFSWTDGANAVRTTDPAGGDLSGVFSNATVVRLLGRALSTTAPQSGQVLTWNGTQWIPTTPASGGGVSDHGALSGLVDDDHPQYLRTNGVRNSNDGFAVTGTFGAGSIPATGAGVRLMWYPGKGALRAGRAQGFEWDDGQVGSFSVAFGDNTIAHGDGGSAAFGFGTFADGLSSAAFGRGTIASGPSSTAFGSSTQASGDAATAFGSGTFASGATSIAGGDGSIASGWGATAFGRNSTASGEGSVAIGRNASASGVTSAAFGDGSIASGRNSTAFGSGNATGILSVAFGGATASGLHAFAVGPSTTTASGEYSVAMGERASTNGRRNSFVYSDDSGLGTVSASRDNQFVVRAAHFWFGHCCQAVSNPAGHFITTTTGAFLSFGGAWTNASDVALKNAFRDVDANNVLNKIARLPIRSWSYKAEDPSVRHVGPTAQDFRAAFGIGNAETSIATVDADGISLLGIQALEKRTRELERENKELRARLERLEAALKQLHH